MVNWRSSKNSKLNVTNVMQAKAIQRNMHILKDAVSTAMNATYTLHMTFNSLSFKR